MPTRATRERIRNATRLRLSLLWAVAYLPIGLHLPYFPVWLAARGLSDTAIATILAAPLIVRVIATPAVAYAADRRGIAATLAASALIALAGYCGLAVVGGFPLIFLMAMLVIAAQGTTPSLADALTLAEIRRLDKAGLGRIEYGRLRGLASIGVLAMMLFSGPIVMMFPGEHIIWALAAVAVAPATADLLVAAGTRKVRLTGWGATGLTDDRPRLRLALVCIGAAALVQASHAQVYTFGTLHWRAIGLSPTFISVAWAVGVAGETLLFFVAGRNLGGERNATRFLLVGAAGAVVRWLAMSTDPGPVAILALQTLHAVSFAATYIGSVLLLGSLAGPNHRARMQSALSATTSLATALATFASGRLTSHFGQGAYVAMAAIAAAGLVLAIAAAVIRARLPPQRT